MLTKIPGYLILVLILMAGLNCDAATNSSALAWEGYALAEEIYNVHGGIKNGAIFNTIGKIVAIYDLQPKFVYPGIVRVGVLAGTYTRDQYQYTNAIQAPSAYLTPRQISPSDLSYQYNFSADDFAIVGIMDMDDNFNITEAGANLLNNAFANTMAMNSATLLTTAPYPGFGAMLQVSKNETTALFGVYQGDPQHLSTVFRQGYLGIAELQQHWANNLNNIDYVFKAGAWLYKQSNPDVTRGCDARGIYLITEANWSTNDDHNLATFLTFGYTDQNPRYVPFSLTAGLRADNIFRKDSKDSLNFGLGKVWVSDFSSEVAYELAYATELYPKWILTPDIQYIVKPNGYSPNAFVLMLRLWYSF